MSNTATGKLIVKQPTQVVNDKFQKREFVIEISEDINGQTYTNYGKFQLTQKKCEVLDRFNEGDNITVSFNIKGNRWEKDGKVNYITNLDAWKIEAGLSQPNEVVHYTAEIANGNTSGYFPNNTAPTYTPTPANPDDLPF